MAPDFYNTLFTAQENLQPNLICQFVPRKVTTHMAETLELAYTASEVERALFQMGPSKAPGPTVALLVFSRSISPWCRIV